MIAIVLAFGAYPHLPILYVWTNGDVCIFADSAEQAEHLWKVTMDVPYRGPAWVPAVHPIVVEVHPSLMWGIPPVPTAKLPRAWVDCARYWGWWLTGGQARARPLPAIGGTLDGVPGRAR